MNVDPSVDDVGPELIVPFYPDLPGFVQHVIVAVFLRRLDGRTRTWCPYWWEHPEAVLRLDALWNSWEYCRLDQSLGMSSWLRDHADYHLGPLLDPDGTFRGCSPDRGHTPRGGTPDWLEPPTDL